MANPPITIGPFDNVPAPGSPIRSDWPQDITDFVNTEIIRPAEWKQATITLSGQGLTTTPVTPGGAALTMGTRGFARILIISAALLLTRTAGTDNNVDMYLGIDTAQRRVRIPVGQSSTQTVAYTVAAGVDATARLRLAATSAGLTVSTSGGADLNYVQVVALPVHRIDAL